MSESWSTSRQALLVCAEALTFASDRQAVLVAALRTYLERGCISAGYIFSGTARWGILTPQNPFHTDIICTMSRILHAHSTINCVCTTDSGVVYCIMSAVDDSGPVVLEYPKYYNEPTLPPGFDIIFRIYSSANIDWSSFTLTITTSSGNNRSYSKKDITTIEITPQITEIRLVPQGLVTILGDTVNVRVYVKDMYGRDLDLNW